MLIPWKLVQSGLSLHLTLTVYQNVMDLRSFAFLSGSFFPIYVSTLLSFAPINSFEMRDEYLYARDAMPTAIFNWRQSLDLPKCLNIVYDA